MKRPTVAECLDEIRRLKAENERLTRLAAEQRPELPVLRAVAVACRDLLFGLPVQLEGLQAQLDAVLPANDDDIASFEELRGCLSDGRDRVEAALDAMDHHAAKKSGKRQA